MLLDVALVALALGLGAWLAFAPRVARSEAWRATATPLASIMGSGFLVSAPLLAGAVGLLSVFCMAALLALAYGVGGALRFNIRHFEPIERHHGAAQGVALVSRFALIGAYFISISYYLQLLASFALEALGVENALAESLITTSLLVVIGGVGMARGLRRLEAVEKYAVALNLGAIGALLAGLAYYNLKLAATGGWALPQVESEIDASDVRMLLGLLIVVQGFETSRYLGQEHPAELRVKTMRAAQLVSSAIYLVFIGLATVLFTPNLGGDVTAIIEMSRPIALVLPIVISCAAMGSQFSAAVADYEGAGGLMEDVTHGRLAPRYAYLLILLVAVALTWETDVRSVIAYASRAFALYYALQCAVAFLVAWPRRDDPGHGLRLATFAGLAVVCLLVFALGTPPE